MGTAKSWKPRVTVARVHPGLNGLPVELAQVLHCEARHADHEKPRRDGRRLPPVSAAHASVKVRLLHQDAVGHHLVVRGRGDDELARGLLRHMVHRGQPVARAVGPVVAEEGALAVLVGAYAEAGRRGAPVAHRHRVPLAGAARPGQPHREEVVLVAVLQGTPSGHDACNLHSLTVGPHANQVERKLHDSVRRETKPHRRPSGDPVDVIAERQLEAVRLDIDAGAEVARRRSLRGAARQNGERASFRAEGVRVSTVTRSGGGALDILARDCIDGNTMTFDAGLSVLHILVYPAWETIQPLRSSRSRCGRCVFVCSTRTPESAVAVCGIYGRIMQHDPSSQAAGGRAERDRESVCVLRRTGAGSARRNNLPRQVRPSLPGPRSAPRARPRLAREPGCTPDSAGPIRSSPTDAATNTLSRVVSLTRGSRGNARPVTPSPLPNILLSAFPSAEHTPRSVTSPVTSLRGVTSEGIVGRARTFGSNPARYAPPRPHRRRAPASPRRRPRSSIGMSAPSSVVQSILGEGTAT